MGYHKVLCKNFQAIYVPGFGGLSKSSSLLTLTSIRETVFGLDYDEDRLKFVPNPVKVCHWFAGYRDENLLKEIKDLAKFHSCNRCENISLVIFGHGNGGEMVVRAFESMKEEMSEADFKKLTDRSAVITMGSSKYIDSNQAKITLNVLLENDNVAKTAAGIVEQNGAKGGKNFMQVGPVKNHVCHCCKERGMPTEGNLKDVGYLSRFSTGLRALWNVWSCFSILQSVSDATSGIGHYSIEYVACRKVRKHIREKLGFSDYPIFCSC